MNTLFRLPAPVPVTDRMTEHQLVAWQMVTSTPGGVFADEVGARVHDHPDDERCIHCGQSGVSILKSKALRGLVIKRKATRKYEAREARYRANDTKYLSNDHSSAQTSELPEWLGGAA